MKRGATISRVRDQPGQNRIHAHKPNLNPSGRAAATLLAPLTAVESPLAMPPAGPPRVEFEFKVSPYHDSTPRTIELDDVLDLSAFGPPTSDSYRHEGGFGITAPLNLPAEQRRDLIEEQLAGLAQAWGFIYATPDLLRAATS